MNRAYFEELYRFYDKQLLEDTIPFWFPRSFDHEHGGFLLMRDEDGTLIDDDKAVWIQGRATWTLSTLYDTVEQRSEWLAGAKLGYDFLLKHCFDGNGKMYFHVARDGSPIRMRRYYYSETFAVLAFSAYAKASGDEEAKKHAIELFQKTVYYATTPDLVVPKFTDVRPAKGLGLPMIMMYITQQMRACFGNEIGNINCTELIDGWIAEVERDFVKDDIRCVMEQVAPDGQIIDHIDGRTLNPGHAIECGWFILHEAKQRNNDARLIVLGCKMIDYMWERGWDKEYGGIIYFRDVYNKPVQEYWQDMKFWWPQNETIVATLLAYTITGNEKYAEWHKLVHDYAYKNFHDSKNGEWFGYLHRDGRVAQTAKGNLYKGPFHLPRQEWYCRSLLGEYLKSL
ncbi:AGE family epimerase/isomerase [Pedobacter sp.]